MLGEYFFSLFQAELDTDADFVNNYRRFIMGFENVGLIWGKTALPEYLKNLEKPGWCRAVTLHHTGAPDLSCRPKGFKMQHIYNLKDFYQNQKRWSAGPHLFVDDDEIFGLSNLLKRGVHAVSFNSFAIGIEVLGNYDVEDPGSGRGLQCWTTAASATKALLHWLNLPVNTETVLFHREDPTTKKMCPGKKVSKEWLLDLIDKADQAAVTSSVYVKPDVGMEWNRWEYQGEKWCVPLYDFMVAKGVKPVTVTRNLKRVAGEYFYGHELLEGAYYQKESSTTWVPVHEIMSLLG